ncbi:hypothetical protein [Pseudomonas sp.]
MITISSAARLGADFTHAPIVNVAPLDDTIHAQLTLASRRLQEHRAHAIP